MRLIGTCSGSQKKKIVENEQGETGEISKIGDFTVRFHPLSPYRKEFEEKGESGEKQVDLIGKGK